MFTFHRPVGVWVAITPWNFPVTIPLEYLGTRAGHRQRRHRQASRVHLLGAARARQGVRRGGGAQGPGVGPPRSGRHRQHPGAASRGRRHRLHRVVGNGPEDHRRDGHQALDHGDVGQRPDHRHRRRRCRRRRRGRRVRGLLQRRPGVLRHRTGDRHRRRPRRVRGARRQGGRRRRARRPFRRGHHDGAAQQRAHCRQDGPAHRRRHRTGGTGAHRGWPAPPGIPPICTTTSPSSMR